MSEQQIILVVVGAIIFAGLLIGFYVLKVVLPAQSREKMTTLANLNAERMALIERNMDPSLAEKKQQKGAGSDPLFWGLLLAGIGLGAFIGYMISYYTGMDKKITTDALGLLFGGMGLVGYHLYKTKGQEVKKHIMELFYIQQIIAGDSSKFSYFIETYKDMAFSIAVRIVNNNEDAEEIVQDAFLKAYTSLNGFRGDSRFSTWLFRIVVNKALNKTRRKLAPTYELDSADLPDHLMENMEESYRKLIQAERIKYINEALNRLKMEDALVLTLYYLQENTIGEIAEITSISTENIKMQLHRARKKMYLAISEVLKTETKNLLS